MEKTRLTVPTNLQQDVPCCPVCGGEPKVAVKLLKRGGRSGDEIETTELVCEVCGLRAPMAVWTALCGKIEHALDREL